MKTLLLVVFFTFGLIQFSQAAEVCTGETIMQKNELKKSALELIRIRNEIGPDEFSRRMSALGAQLENLAYNNKLGVCLDQGQALDLGKFVGQVGQLLQLQDVVLFREQAKQFNFESAASNSNGRENFRIPSGFNSRIET